MKKACCMMLILLLTAGVLPASCAGTRNSSSPGEVILYTCYRQTGWGDRVQIGCVDGDGGLWLLTGYDSELQWPEDPEEQLSFLASCRRMENAGKLSSDDLFELKSLISGTEDQGRAAHPSAEDAGTEKSWAVQRNADGTAQWILLGVSGAFTYLLTYLKIPGKVAAALFAITDNKFLILIMLNVMMLILGCLIEMACLILMLTPVILPIWVQMGLSPIHIGIVMVLNLGIGLLTPPVGSTLFIGSAISGIKIETLSKKMVPFYITMAVALIILTYFPQSFMWLPSMLYN